MERGKIAEEWSEGGGLVELTQGASRAREDRARARRAGAEGSKAHPASLTAQGGAQLEGWQIAPYYQPAREVEGDFYDFHLLSEGRLGLVVGDATGKGVPAALVMSTTCGMLQGTSPEPYYLFTWGGTRARQ